MDTASIEIVINTGSVNAYETVEKVLEFEAGVRELALKILRQSQIQMVSTITRNFAQYAGT